MPNCKIIFDTMDLHYLRLERQAEVLEKKQATQAVLVKKLEFSLMRKSNITILTSPVEYEILNKENELSTFAILPNIHAESENHVEPFGKRNDIMFIGSFLHDPNVDAVKYFINEILPNIKQKIQNVKFFIIGSNPTEEIKKLASDDVIVTGFVKDLQPFYDKYRVMVAPLRYGAGIKGKVTQSLTKGLPLITTPIGAEGMNLIDGEHCMISENPDEFAEKTIQVYNNEKLWSKLSKNGMDIAQEYSAEKAKASFELMFSSLYQK
jgi:glycosyltransferase involved in cell wall biosynthesis